jgi:hypothetical protein
MNSAEYSTYRKNDADRKSTLIDIQITSIEDTISSISGTIQTDKDNILSNQTIVKQQFSERDTEYRACTSAGKYISGTFIRTYPETECKSRLSEWNKKINLTNNDILLLDQKSIFDKNQLIQYQYYAALFKIQKKLLQLSKENIPHELGAFEPESTLAIALNTGSAHTVADYFETLTHEYLHYASYISPQKMLNDTFFEEGLTEYFARMTIQNDLDTSTNLGYPVFVKIITQMTVLIPESELADIYFSKDEAGLEAALDRVYGEDFYKNNRILFITLQDTSDPKQILTIANQIMKKIHGNPLQEKDLYSTTSKLD